jgi:copper transport protein
VTRRLLAVLVMLAGLLGAGLLLAPGASAHATIVATDPVDGSRLNAVPSTVTITFDQPVGLGTIGYLHVINQLGARVDAGAATHPNSDGTKISVALKSGLGDGTYTASFRIISADSHPVAGALRFIVGNGSFAAAATSGGPTVNAVTSVVFDLVRVASFAGLALLGGAWLMLTIWPAGRDDRRARGLVWAGWWTSVAGALAELLVQGPYDAGTGLRTGTHWSLLDATLHTDFGLAHSLRLIALGILAGVLGSLLRWMERSRTGLEELAGLLVVAIAVTFAESGHASSEHPKWLAMTSDTLHLLAMGAWAGGLAYLLIAVLPRREPTELAAVLPTFSRVAYVSVATLAITGTYQAWLGVGSWRALAITSYGRLVLLKVVLFIALLALGNWSRRHVQRRWPARLPLAYAMADGPPPALVPVDLLDTAAGDEPGDGPDEHADDDGPPGDDERADVRVLVRTVLVEVLLAAAVLGATGVLVAEPPGQAALITIDSRPHTVSADIGGGRSAAITVSSQRHGPVQVSVVLSAGAAPQQLTLTAGLAAKQLGPITVPLAASSANHYSASSVLLPAAGSWLFTLTVRTSEFDSTVTDATIDLH